PPQWRPRLIASGGNDSDTAWTETLSREVKNQADAISFHYYTIPTGSWEKKGAATGFGEDQWISTLAATLRMDASIRKNVAILDKNDPEKKLGFAVDEWGTWYDAAPGANPGFLYQDNTLRDAIVAALNFNVFHAHADRVRMTNIAQMVNVLQAMILTDKERMLLTPTYHAYRMYVPFQDAKSVPVAIDGNADYKLGALSVPQVSASAAIGKDGKLYLALVNTDPHQEAEVDLAVAGRKVAHARGQVLTAAAMDARNSFTAPQAVKPAPYAADAQGGKLALRLPAKSVVVTALEE
ncbi:MAG TPA: alpha-L-arabinofuranosidase C-terminal domain-containing protein, partial [Telluria sp.]|nr:alpha-L-arabinofuranosidase C-terminal domain-containing protein [Telluria sp.]